MSWILTADTGRFLAVAGEFLRADPAGNSVMLTVTENLRVSAATRRRLQPGPEGVRILVIGSAAGERYVRPEGLQLPERS